MGQEAAPFINSLNRAWPLSTDKIRFGAVHLRTIKGALLDTFPNVTGAVTLTHTQLNDAVRKSANNELTGIAAVLDAPIKLTSSNPGLFMSKTTAALDEKNWRISPSLEELRLEMVSDDGLTIDYFFRANRNAMTMALIEMIATSIKLNGTVETGGPIHVGHASDTTLARSRAGQLSMEGIDIGYLGMPLNNQSGDYTTVLADAGKMMYHPSGAGAGDTFTIGGSGSVLYPTETIIGFANLATDELEIDVGGSDSLRAMGSGAFGPFLLPQFCVAAAWKYTSTAWLIGGQGLHT